MSADILPPTPENIGLVILVLVAIFAVVGLTEWYRKIKDEEANEEIRERQKELQRRDEEDKLIAGREELDEQDQQDQNDDK